MQHGWRQQQYNSIYGSGVPGLEGGGTKWYLAPDVNPAICIAAYQPIGAISLAASYTNLITPGIHDAIPTVAPTWSAGAGWIFDTTQYLTTDLVPASGWSAIVRFSNIAAGNSRAIFGEWAATDTKFGIIPWRAATNNVDYWNGQSTTVAPQLAAGVLAVAGADGYRNGVDEANIAAWTGTTLLNMLIGGYNNAGTPNVAIAVNIQAIAFYTATLTPTQVATITARMAALPL